MVVGSGSLSYGIDVQSVEAESQMITRRPEAASEDCAYSSASFVYVISSL